MRHLTRTLTALSLVAALGCGSSTSPTTNGGAQVQVGDNFFSPASLTVTAGTSGAKVTWTWVGSASHSVTFDNSGPASNVQSSGTFTHTFTTPGTYTYFCTVHGRAVMSGTLIVQ